MAVVVGVCLVTLLGGYLLKAQCLQGFDGRQYSRLCYNDIQPLYSVRDVEGGFPYVDGRLQDGELVDGAIEYPVLTGVFMWATGLVADDANSYLNVSTVLLAPFGLLVAYLLARMAGLRALLWAAAPAIVLYAFHNWDLLVVAAAVAGLWSWHRGRPIWAAVAFGVGASLKLYPLLFLAPLFLERLFDGDRRGAAGVLGAGAGTVALVNLPFLIAGAEGWFAIFEFHRVRGPNYDNLWFVAWPTASPGTLNLVTAGLTAATGAVVMAVGWGRARSYGTYPFLATSGALLATFLLWNKVHSPQYALWILPFFVLLPVSVLWWALYALADLMVYVGVFRWFYDVLYQGHEFGEQTAFKTLMEYGVWARAGLLLVLIVFFLRARPPPGASLPARKVSEPPPTLTAVGERQPVPG